MIRSFCWVVMVSSLLILRNLALILQKMWNSLAISLIIRLLNVLSNFQKIQIVMSRFRKKKKSKSTRPHTQVFDIGGRRL